MSMVDNLPTLYRKDPWILALAAALGEALEQRSTGIADLGPQMSLDTVSWNLAVEERVAGIVPPTGATLESRRSALKARYRTSGKVSIETILSVAALFVDGDVAAEPGPEGYFFRLNLILSSGAYPDYGLILDAVDLVKPAHLAYQVALHFTPGITVHAGFSTRIGEVYIAGPVECSGYLKSQAYAAAVARRGDVVRMNALACPQPEEPVTVGLLGRQGETIITRMVLE